MELPLCRHCLLLRSLAPPIALVQSGQLPCPSPTMGHHHSKIQLTLEEVRNDTYSSPMLCLMQKHLGSEGAKHACEALMNNRSITSVLLSINSIGPAAAPAICDLLRTNNVIQDLNLGYNDLGNEGACLLSGVIAANTSITKLDLSYNGIGEAGIAALRKALIFNSTIDDLNLGGNAAQSTNVPSKAERAMMRAFFEGDHERALESLADAHCHLKWLSELPEESKLQVPSDKIDAGREAIIAYIKSTMY